MNGNCACGGPLVPIRIGITEKGILQGTVCWKLWCPKCDNSALDYNGNVIYYQMMGSGKYSMDPMDFWVPESVKYQYKQKFVETVLRLADKNKFSLYQFYEMNEIRQAYKTGENK